MEKLVIPKRKKFFSEILFFVVGKKIVSTCDMSKIVGVLKVKLKPEGFEEDKIKKMNKGCFK